MTLVDEIDGGMPAHNTNNEASSDKDAEDEELLGEE